MRILISSVGRRVGLMHCFRESLSELSGGGRIIAVDSSPSAPALQFADRGYAVPRCDDPAFLTRIAEICRLERVDLVVPTIDPELRVYARCGPDFAQTGTAVCVSSLAAVELCEDKLLTNQWLRAKRFPATRQYPLCQCLGERARSTFPLVLKPRRGSGSAGVRVVASQQELSAWATKLANGEEYLIEQVALGEEYTINVFVDSRGTCRAAVPHRRLEVRAGEVSKAVTVKNPALMDLARDIAEALPGAWGPLSIQCFLAPDSSIRVTEINPRFGGGYPLTHRAGAPFTRCLVEQHNRFQVRSLDDWVDGLLMLRYDHEVFLPASRCQAPGTLCYRDNLSLAPSPGALEAVEA